MTRIGQNLNKKLHGSMHNIIMNYNAVNSNAEHREMNTSHASKRYDF